LYEQRHGGNNESEKIENRFRQAQLSTDINDEAAILRFQTKLMTEAHFKGVVHATSIVKYKTSSGNKTY